MSVMQKYFIFTILTMLVVFGVLYYVFRDKTNDYMIQTNPSSLTASDTSVVIESPPIVKPPEVRIFYKKDKKTIIIEWENLPENTARLNIYRTRISTGSSTLWKTINIDSNNVAAGNTEFALGKNESVSNYSFYTQAISNDGGNNVIGYSSSSGTNNNSGENILWTSSSTPPLPEPSPASTSPTSGNNSNNTSSSNSTSTQSQGNQTSATTTASSTSQTQNNSNNNQSGNSGTPSNVIQYYSPQGALTGSSTPQTGSFWVEHIQKSIEVGWQSLPTTTDKAVVSRSQNNTNGPWLELITQANINPSEPYYVRFVDDTLTNPYYYKLDIFSGSQSIGMYGPVYLEGLPQ